MWERVYTINEFWDGPRLGVADVSAVPYIYSSPFNVENDDFEDFFLVSPIDPELLSLVLEDWDIWLRWREAFDKGETTKETHPALPADRPRSQELKGFLGTRLAVDVQNCKKLFAEFGGNGTKVKWSDVGVTEAVPTLPDQCEPD
jgi:hypothetical protein